MGCVSGSEGFMKFCRVRSKLSQRSTAGNISGENGIMCEACN